MADRLDLYFRAHAIPAISQKEDWRDGHPREPEHALIFHCATTADEKQDLLFGAYICAELKGAQFVAKEIGLFHRGGHPEELRVLQRFVKGSAFALGTIEEFRRKVFLKYLKATSDSLRSFLAPTRRVRLSRKLAPISPRFRRASWPAAFPSPCSKTSGSSAARRG